MKNNSRKAQFKVVSPCPLCGGTKKHARGCENRGKVLIAQREPDMQVFKTFDELVGFLFEEHSVSDNNPLDDFVSFRMSDGSPVRAWVYAVENGKRVVTISDITAHTREVVVPGGVEVQVSTNLFDVVEVSIKTYKVIKLIDARKTEANADAIVKMAVIRRGVKKSFFATVPTLSVKVGDIYRGPGDFERPLRAPHGCQVFPVSVPAQSHNLTIDQALAFLKNPMPGHMLMAKNVDGDEEEWTELDPTDRADFENIEDGTYHTLQIWKRDNECVASTDGRGRLTWHGNDKRREPRRKGAR